MKSSEKKHILFIVQNLPVPFDKRVWREAKALKENNAYVSIICPRGRKFNTEKYTIIEGIYIYRYKIPFTQTTKTGYIFEYIKSFLATLFLFIRINSIKKVDTIHAANPPEIFFPIGWLKRLLGFKFIFDHHDLSPESYLYKFNRSKKSYIYRALLLFEKLTFRTSDLIISTNESIARISSERNKIPISEIIVVRNGPDKYFSPEKYDIKHKNGKKYLASYLGVMGKTDGVEYIVYAADYLIKSGFTDIHFKLIGYGDEFANINNLVNESGLQNYFTLPGRLPDSEVLEILYSSDVCLAPDPKNGLNEFHTMNKIMDYMRCEKPIVSFDLAETRITAEESAIYVPDNDISEYAKAIKFLLENEETRIKMGKAGKTRVDKLLNWEISKEKLVSAYESLYVSGKR